MVAIQPPPTATASLAHLLIDLLRPTPAPISNPAIDKRPASLSDSDLHELTAALDSFLRAQYRRQAQGNGQPPRAAGYPDCSNVGNDVLTCYPNGTTTLVQDEWSKVIFNSKYPTFIGAGAVDIYLFRNSDEAMVANYTDIPTARGIISIQPDDSWLPVQTTWTPGQNLTHSYYFEIVPAGQALSGGEQRQPVFDVIQTAPPATLSAAVAAASLAVSASAVSAVLSSAASLSSLSSAIAAGAITLSGAEATSFSSAIAGLSSVTASRSRTNVSGSARGSLASDNNDDGFPAYGIAILAVLGGLLLIFALATAFLLYRLHRRRQQARSDSEEAFRQPILVTGGVRTSGEDGHEKEGSPTSAHGPGSFAGPVGATPLRTRASDGAEDPPASAISGTDAAIMAEAFRKALRQPEFPPSSGDPSPSSGIGSAGAPTAEETGFSAAVAASATPRPRSRLSSTAVVDPDADESSIVGRELIDKELASEGRSMRSVADLKRAALVDAGEDQAAVPRTTSPS